MPGKLKYFLIALVILASLSLRADEWPGPQTREVFSSSREWFVRVIPGKSLGDTVGFAGSPTGPYAKAEFYQRQKNRSYRLVKEITLLNPVAPVLFLVTDRGYLVTLDNWHNMGYGKAAVSYSPQGRPVFSYELKDLFTPPEIEQFTRSNSSIWWRTENVYVRDEQQSVYITLDDRGSAIIVEPETGAWQFCESKDVAHACRTSNSNRVWTRYAEPQLRR